MRAFTILTFAIAAIATPLQNRQSNPSINLTELYTCNGAPYAPLNYTCYDDQLCSVINGRTQGECRGACYDPALYGYLQFPLNNKSPVPAQTYNRISVP
jgi:hypothetical protein